MRRGEKFLLRFEIGDAEAWQAALARAEEFARAAQAQIFLGDAEAVFRLAHDLDASLRRFAERRLIEKQATRFSVPRPTRPRN